MKNLQKKDLDPEFVAKYGGNVNIEYFLFVIVVVSFSVWPVSNINISSK